MGYDDFSAPTEASPAPSGYDSFSSPVKPTQAAQPAPAPEYNSDQGPYKDLPVWLRPDNAFNRFTNMAAHGATMGLSSEVKPVSEAAVTAAKTGSLSQGAERYHQEKQKTAQQVEQGREEFGMLPELIGGVGGMRATPGAAAPAIAPTLPERTVAAMKGGAGAGAIYGATEGDGTLGERAGNAGRSAIAGMVTGPLLSEVAVPLGVHAAGYLPSADRMGHVLRNVVPGVKADVDRTLFYTLRDQGMTPDQAWAELEKARGAAKFGQTQLDPYYTLADTGPATQSLAYSVKSSSGPSKSYAENFLDARSKGTDELPNSAGFSGPNMRGQHERVEDYTQRALQAVRDKNAAKVEDKLKAKQKAEKDPAYDAFNNFPDAIPVEDILQSHAQDLASKVTTGSKLAKQIDAAYEPFMDEPHGIGATQMPSLTDRASYNLKMQSLDKKIAKAAEKAKNSNDPEDFAQFQSLQDLQKGLTQQYNTKTQPQNLTQITYDLPTEKFDTAKKQLDGLIRAARNDRTDPNAKYRESLLLDLKHKLLARADEVTAIKDAAGNPVLDSSGNPTSLYRTARESYSEPQDILDAIEQGRQFKKIDIDRINQTLKDYSTPEKRGFRIGAATDIRQDLGDIARGSNVARYFNKPNMDVRMQAMAGPSRAKQHKELMNVENQMAKTKNKVNEGSRTEENKQANEERAMWLRVGRKLGSNPLAALHDLVGTSIAHLYRYQKMDALQLARSLFDTNPLRQKATIDRLNARYGPQNVTAAIQHARMLTAQAISTGLSGPISSRESGAEGRAKGGAVNDHASRLNEIENSNAHPDEKRRVRRQIFEEALQAP